MSGGYAFGGGSPPGGRGGYGGGRGGGRGRGGGGYGGGRGGGYGGGGGGYQGYNGGGYGDGGYDEGAGGGEEGGGGYMPDGGAGQAGGSPGAAGGRGGRQEQKMLQEAESKTEGKFKIDNKDLAAVTIVGQIKTIDLQTTFVDYDIDDGTGTMICKVFVDDDAGVSAHSQFREGLWVRAVGNLRTPFHNQRSIVAFKVLPVTDMSEVNYHQLEVTACRLRNTKGFAPPSSGSPGSSSSSSVVAGDSKARPAVKAEAAAAQMDTGPDRGGFTPQQRQVLTIFENDKSADGVSLDTIRSQLPGINTTDLRKIIDFLSEEGHLYSTVDEDHYKCTNPRE